MLEQIDKDVGAILLRARYHDPEYKKADQAFTDAVKSQEVMDATKAVCDQIGYAPGVTWENISVPNRQKLAEELLIEKNFNRNAELAANPIASLDIALTEHLNIDKFKDATYGAGAESKLLNEFSQTVAHYDDVSKNLARLYPSNDAKLLTKEGLLALEKAAKEPHIALTAANFELLKEYATLRNIDWAPSGTVVPPAPTPVSAVKAEDPVITPAVTTVKAEPGTNLAHNLPAAETEEYKQLASILKRAAENHPDHAANKKLLDTEIELTSSYNSDSVQKLRSQWLNRKDELVTAFKPENLTAETLVELKKIEGLQESDVKLINQYLPAEHALPVTVNTTVLAEHARYMPSEPAVHSQTNPATQPSPATITNEKIDLPGTIDQVRKPYPESVRVASTADKIKQLKKEQTPNWFARKFGKKSFTPAGELEMQAGKFFESDASLALAKDLFGIREDVVTTIGMPSNRSIFADAMRSVVGHKELTQSQLDALNRFTKDPLTLHDCMKIGNNFRSGSIDYYSTFREMAVKYKNVQFMTHPVSVKPTIQPNDPAAAKPTIAEEVRAPAETIIFDEVPGTRVSSIFHSAKTNAVNRSLRETPTGVTEEVTKTGKNWLKEHPGKAAVIGLAALGLGGWAMRSRTHPDTQSDQQQGRL